MQRSTYTLQVRRGLALLVLPALGAAAACTSGGSEAAPPPVESVARAEATGRLASLVTVNPDPFANSSTEPPPDSVYSGPLFRMSHDYPTALLFRTGEPSWRRALKGHSISTANALEYVDSLKSYIEPDMRQLIFDYAKWDAAKARWYDQPWQANLREPIHGMYVGTTDFPPNTLTGQKDSIATYVLTYYNETAGYTLGRVWGKTAKDPDLAAAQFEEGAVIVKLAFETSPPSRFPAMEGAASWPIYAPPPTQDTLPPALSNVYLMQIDIVVKDSKTAPATGWVYSTLVYDKDAKGDVWQKMVPLGAMWGNDPQATAPTDELRETVINPRAPAYSTATLGWGGRLSGPNDGAVVAPAYVDGKAAGSVAASSCMSCHGVAEWPMKSFLLPAPATPDEDGIHVDPRTIDNDLDLYTPASAPWMEWFQNRPGNVPQDTGTVALDYDMVFAFKALPAWAAWKKEQESRGTEAVRRVIREYRKGREYNGLP